MSKSKTYWAIALAAGLLCASAPALAVVTWSGDTTVNNDWFTTSNWSGSAVPTSADDTQLYAGSSLANPVIVNNASAAAAYYLRIGYGSGNAGYLKIYTDLSTVRDLYVGSNGGAGEVVQEGGTVNIATIAAGGYNTRIDGKYTINGGTAYFGTVNNQHLYVGEATDSTGRLIINAGAVSVGDQTLLGNAAGSTGILQALGGTFTAQNDWLTVGNNGIGQVTVNGGTMNLGSVRVGQYADSASRTSTFSLISGTVDIKDQCNFNLGVAGNASFTQSGGTFQLNNRSDLTVASGAGTASYEISGGSLYVGRTLYVGKAGPGTFTVSGSGVTSISVGAEQATTDFQVFATGTLTAKIDAGGITAIQVKNAAQFDAGSKLDVAALAGAAPGTYTVLQVYGTGTGDKIIDNGLAFAAGVDTSKWSFSIVDSNSDTRLDRL